MKLVVPAIQTTPNDEEICVGGINGNFDEKKKCGEGGLGDEKSEDKLKSALPADWIEERFRVDRRKLEEMILGKLYP